MSLEIQIARLDDERVIVLTTASVAEMASRYGGQLGVGPKPRPEEFLPPDGTFLLALLDGTPAGCGGLSRIDAETGEIRRMYTTQEVRGRGISKLVLARLLDLARELGYRRVWLETGNRQPEAFGLYRGAGFTPVPCWGPFLEDPKSLCFELEL